MFQYYFIIFALKSVYQIPMPIQQVPLGNLLMNIINIQYTILFLYNITVMPIMLETTIMSINIYYGLHMSYPVDSPMRY